WLDATLAAEPDKPTLLLMHHPPFATSIARMDQAGLDDTAAFAEVVGRHPQIERILCGHLHRAIDSRFAGTLAATCPSTAHQMQLNLTGSLTVRFMFEPPGYRLHLWHEGAGLVTHTVAIGDWPGPYPLREPPTD